MGFPRNTGALPPGGEEWMWAGLNQSTPMRSPLPAFSSYQSRTQLLNQSSLIATYILLFSLNMPLEGEEGLDVLGEDSSTAHYSPSCSHLSTPLLPVLDSLHPEPPWHSLWLLPRLSHPSLPTTAQLRADGFGGVSGFYSAQT